MTEVSSSREVSLFVERIRLLGADLYRDFPWRGDPGPYGALVSEFMLQQTQVSRVVPYYERWMDDFPDLETLADAPLAIVLERWQGLGYNRRGMWLKRAAETVVESHRAERRSGPAGLPSDSEALRSLPGVGPATAAGVRAFGFRLPSVYFETNVRTVFLHDFFGDAAGVRDSAVTPLVALAADEAARQGISPHEWNYALLDYGAYLKKTVPNPSRRSAHHKRQSRFEGSTRQKSAWLLREVVSDPGLSADEYAVRLAAFEQVNGRGAPELRVAKALLDRLVTDGMLVRTDGRYSIA